MRISTQNIIQKLRADTPSLNRASAFKSQKFPDFRKPHSCGAYSVELTRWTLLSGPYLPWWTLPEWMHTRSFLHAEVGFGSGRVRTSKAVLTCWQTRTSGHATYAPLIQRLQDVFTIPGRGVAYRRDCGAVVCVYCCFLTLGGLRPRVYLRVANISRRVVF